MIDFTKMQNGIPYGSHFYCCRHGQTTDNVEEVASGSGRNPDLTELGENQARNLLPVLSKLDPKISYIITSELKRTIDTAHLASYSLDLQQYKDAGINERFHGQGEGTPEEEYQARSNRGEYFPDAERQEHHQARVLKALADNLKHNMQEHEIDGKIPLFVSHAGTMRRILDMACADIPDFKQKDDYKKLPNSTVYEFIAPKNELDKWKINVIGLDEQEQIKRKPFGSSQSVVDNLPITGFGGGIGV